MAAWRPLIRSIKRESIRRGYLQLVGKNLNERQAIKSSLCEASATYKAW